MKVEIRQREARVGCTMKRIAEAPRTGSDTLWSWVASLHKTVVCATNDKICYTSFQNDRQTRNMQAPPPPSLCRHAEVVETVESRARENYVNIALVRSKRGLSVCGKAGRYASHSDRAWRAVRARVTRTTADRTARSRAHVRHVHHA